MPYSHLREKGYSDSQAKAIMAKEKGRKKKKKKTKGTKSLSSNIIKGMK